MNGRTPAIPAYIAPEEKNAPVGYTRQIPVVFATNDNYAPYTGVAIASILHNASPENYYRIYILHTGLAGGAIQRLEGMGQDNAAVRCLNVQPLLDGYGVALHERAHFTKETYYRFLIPEIFCDFSDVIYLDGDLVAEADVADMIPADPGEAWISAVINVLTGQSTQRVWTDFGVEPGKYFNAGVLVMHIPQWREHGLADRCFALLDKTPWEKLMLLDQDILNAVCRGHVCFLDPAWNYCWHLDHTASEEIESLFAPIKAAVDGKFKILHFASDHKPWNRPELPLAGRFWRYAADSPFYEEILIRSRAAAAEACERKNQKEIAGKEKALAALEEEKRQLEEEKRQLAERTDALKREKEELEKQLDAQRVAQTKTQGQLEREKRQREKAEREVENIRGSLSYRIGRAVTWLPRKLLALLRRKNGRE